MTDETVTRLAAVLAAYSRVLGMQALNMQRAALGHSMAYTDADFFHDADLIEKAAQAQEVKP